MKTSKTVRTRRFIVLGLIGGIAALVAVFLATRSGERTVTVCRSGCDFANIQAALSALSAGDALSLRAGTYQENLIISKSLQIIGADPAKTVIEGEFTIENAQNVILTGFTLKGPLRIKNSKLIQLKDVQITGSAGDGLAIVNSTSVTVSRSAINANGADGIAIVSSQVELRDNLIGGNASCGIRADATSRITGGHNQSGGSRVPEDFKSVQEAINAWRPEMGPNSAGNLCGPLAPDLLTGSGAIVIAPGIYRERLTIRDQRIFLQGAGLAETILDGDGLGEVDGITLRGKAQLIIAGITVRNFRDDGLDAEGPIELTIRKSAFIANRSNGLEIAHDLVRMSLSNSIIRENFNYGLWALRAENILECRENTVSGNGTDYGGLSSDIAAAIAQKCQGGP